MHSWNRALLSPPTSPTLGRPVTAHTKVEVPPLRSCLKVRSDNVPTVFSPPSGETKKSVRFGPSQIVEIPAREGPPGRKRRKVKTRVVYPTLRFDASPQMECLTPWSHMSPLDASIAMRRFSPGAIAPTPRRERHKSVLAPSKRRLVLAHSFRTGALRASQFLSVRPSMPNPVDFAPQSVLAPSKLQSVPAPTSQAAVVRRHLKTSMSKVIDVLQASVPPVLVQYIFLILVLLGFCFPGIWDILLLAMVGYMAFQKETVQRPWCAPLVGGQGISSRWFPRSYSGLSDVRPSWAGR